MKTLNHTHFPFLQNLVTKGLIRSKDVSMALGYGIAQNAALPSDKSDTVDSYFLGTHGEDTDLFLSALVNIVPIDYKCARAYALKFYKMRHSLAFGFTDLQPVTKNSLYDLLGISSIFSDEEIQLMEKRDGLRNLGASFAEIVRNYHV